MASITYNCLLQQYSVGTYIYRGVAKILGKGGEYARTKHVRKIWPHPLTEWKGPSPNYHGERVLTVASELEPRFLTAFLDKSLVVFYAVFLIVADGLG